jgi:hypothetical protein
MGIHRFGWSALIAAPVLLVVTEAAPAQTAVLRGDDEVRACLCLDQRLPALNGDVQAQRRAYQEKQEASAALEKQIQIQRALVDVNNPAEVDAFKQLLGRRDAAADALNGQTSSYADVVRRYNEAVAQYNDNCAGKPLDPDAKARVSRNLVCPKP